MTHQHPRLPTTIYTGLLGTLGHKETCSTMVSEQISTSDLWCGSLCPRMVQATKCQVITTQMPVSNLQELDLSLE